MQKGNSVKWLGGKDDPRGLKKIFLMVSSKTAYVMCI